MTGALPICEHQFPSLQFIYQMLMGCCKLYPSELMGLRSLSPHKKPSVLTEHSQPKSTRILSRKLKYSYQKNISYTNLRSEGLP